MRCPYCDAQLEEHSPSCPDCRLDLQRVGQLLGPVPRIEPGVCDSSDALTPSESKRLRRRIDELARRFPQIRVQIVFRHFANEHPIRLHAFWMFNLGAMSTETEKHGDNRRILLLIDPVEGSAALTPGYGLEPFLTDEELDALLGMAEDSWRNKEWHAGVLTLLDGLEALLERAAVRSAKALGHSPREAPDGA